MAKLLLLCVLCAFMVGLQIRETAAQQSRVCFAQSSDLSTNTALGFCSHAIYMAITTSSSGSIGLINPMIDGDLSSGGIAKFASRKTVYPYVEMYLGLVAKASTGNLQWLSSASSRSSLISSLVGGIQMYSQISGVYIDFDGVTSSSDYSSFVSSLNTALIAVGLKLTTALPYDTTTYASIYKNPTLPMLPFNVVKTYDDVYATMTTLTHPISPVLPLSAPFDSYINTISNVVFQWVILGIPPSNIILGLPMYSLKFTTSGATAFGGAATALVKDTYCNALIFATTNTPGLDQFGETFAYNASTFYTYNTNAAISDKLFFLTTWGLAGVGVYSLDQAGGTNAEMLRYVTSVLAPTPPSGFTYPAAEAAVCNVPITFPVPPPTTPTTPTTTTTTTPTTTTTTTPTTTTTTTTPTTTTTTTTPTTTTTTTPTTTTTTTTPTTTTTTTTPTTTTTTTTPTTTTTTTTPTTTTTTTPTTTTTTTTPTTTTTTTPTTTTAPPVATATCGVAVLSTYGSLLDNFCGGLGSISAYLAVFAGIVL